VLSTAYGLLVSIFSPRVIKQVALSHGHLIAEEAGRPLDHAYAYRSVGYLYLRQKEYL
jgi:hypothetical protein